METTPNTFCTRLAALTEGLEYDPVSSCFKGMVVIDGKNVKVVVSSTLLFNLELIKNMVESDNFTKFLKDFRLAICMQALKAYSEVK